MGDATNPGDGQNFFQTQRNDIPTAPAGPTNLQRDAYTDFVPARPQQHQPEQTALNGAQGGFVTIQDGNDTFYVPAGSRVVIRHGGDAQVTRVGGNGQGGYDANYADRMASRQAQVANPQARPYYGDSYQNVNGAGYEVPQPIYQPYRPNPVGQFLGNVAGAFAGAFLGAHFAGGYGRHGGFYRPGPPFMPYRPGVFVGAQIGPSWQAQNYNYYNQGGYYNQAAAYNPTQYDASGNPIYYS
jgi:hypothetical protein